MAIAFQDIDIEAPIEKWINQFFFEIVFHINYKEVIPKVIDTIGSNLFKQSKFWILYTRYKVGEAKANDKKKVMLTIVDTACLHKLDNKKMLYDYFVSMIKLFFNLEKVHLFLTKTMKVYIHDYAFKMTDYSYLLNNGQYFRNSSDLNEKKSESIYDKYVIKSSKDNLLQKIDRFNYIGFKRNIIDKRCEELCYNCSK